MAFSETVSNNPSSTFKSLQLKEGEGPGPAETQRRPMWYLLSAKGRVGGLVHCSSHPLRSGYPHGVQNPQALKTLGRLRRSAASRGAEGQRGASTDMQLPQVSGTRTGPPRGPVQLAWVSCCLPFLIRTAIRFPRSFLSLGAERTWRSSRATRLHWWV